MVRDALFLVTSRLRDNMLPTKAIDGAGAAGIYHSTLPESASYGRIREPTSPVSYSSLGLSHMLDRPTSLAHSMDHLGLSHNIDRPPSPRLWSSQVNISLYSISHSHYNLLGKLVRADLK